jgi:hypothetical protein
VQRVLVFVSALVALAVAAVLAVGVGAHTVHAQAAPSASSVTRTATAPTATVAPDAGHTCYVGVPRCSQTPCIEYINAQAVLITPVPGIRLATPARCPSTTGPGKGAVTVTPRGRVGPAPIPNFAQNLPALAHKLQARPAGSP